MSQEQLSLSISVDLVPNRGYLKFKNVIARLKRQCWVCAGYPVAPFQPKPWEGARLQVGEGVKVELEKLRALSQDQQSIIQTNMNKSPSNQTEASMQHELTG